MPVKKTKKPRTRRAPAKKKGLKQKQKQKQQQKVNVQVSTGGGGGGVTQFIPIPSAPAFDYAQLASLIRPANTVDVPIRAQANAEPLPAREAKAPSLASAREAKAPSLTSESESDVPFRTSKSASRPSSFYRSSGFIPPSGEGSGKKTKYETDIFGRDMPMTSSITASPSFEATGGGGRRSSNIVSYLDLPSGGGKAGASFL